MKNNIYILSILCAVLYSCSNSSYSDLEKRKVVEKVADGTVTDDEEGSDDEEDNISVLSIDFIPSEINFGEVIIGSQKELSFSIKNTSNKNIIILDISNSDNVFIANSFQEKKIQANTEAVFPITFSPLEARKYENIITIRSNLEFQNSTLKSIGVGMVDMVKPEVTYSNNIKPLMIQNCAITGCHDAITKTKGFSFVTYQETKENFKGTSFHDPLPQIEEGLMPRGLPKFDKEKIDLLKCWIQNGFKL